MFLLSALLLSVEHQAKDVEAELGELEAHLTELVLGLVAQDVGAVGPECGDGLADDRVFARGVCVDEAGVGDLAFGVGVYAVDFGVREGFEFLARGEGGLVWLCVDGVNWG
jgi:hypothetical protein